MLKDKIIFFKKTKVKLCLPLKPVIFIKPRLTTKKENPKINKVKFSIKKNA